MDELDRRTDEVDILVPGLREGESVLIITTLELGSGVDGERLCWKITLILTSVSLLGGGEGGRGSGPKKTLPSESVLGGGLFFGRSGLTLAELAQMIAKTVTRAAMFLGKK